MLLTYSFLSVSNGFFCAFQVTIASGTLVPQRTKLMLATEDEGFSDGEEEESSEYPGVRVWRNEDEDSESSDIEDFAEGKPNTITMI